MIIMRPLILIFCAALAMQAAPLRDHAATFRARRTQKMLPCWLRTVDATNGGFLLLDDLVKVLTAPARYGWMAR